MLRLPLALIPSGSILPILSGQNRGLRWQVGTSVHGCWIGWYEREVQAALAARVKTGMVAWDLGAQAGFYSLMMSRLVGSGGKVIAVEPRQSNRNSIRRHLELNLIKNVTLIEAAVSDVDGEAMFDESGDLSMGSIISGRGTVRTPTRTLDSLIAAGMPAPDVVKMDVEGSESAVLKGAADLLSRVHPTWLIAIHGSENATRCVSELGRFGYCISDLRGRSLPRNPGEDFVCLATVA